MVKRLGRIAQVVLFKQLDRPLDYSIPAPFLGRLKPGMRVRVPVRNHEATGIVVGRVENPEVPQVRPILELLDEAPVIDESLLKLAHKLADYYLSGWGTAIRAVLPPGLDASPQLLYRLTDQGREVHTRSARMPKSQQALLRILRQSPSGGQRGLTAKALSRRTQIASIASSLQALIKKGWVERHTTFPRHRSRPVAAMAEPPRQLQQRSLSLPFPNQEAGMNAIGEALSARRFEVFCLQGVLREAALPFIAAVANKTLEKQQEILILVPEVAQADALTAELANALERPVGILHGELSPGVRRATWQRMAAGDFPVTVGTRTAVFAPLKALGLIVVTQEADASYKAEESPPYHVRDVALMRGQMHRIPVLLTALVPSVETYAKCRNGEYHTLSSTRSSFTATPTLTLPLEGGGMGGSATHNSQLRTSVVDMRSLRTGQILSEMLIDAIKKRLRVRRPVLLLLNRRGFATAVLCRDCGYVFRCPRCNVAQVLHRQVHRLICHYCGTRQGPPTACPTCKGIRVGGIGMGTEQAEETLRRTFPEARILRLDRDTRPSGFRKADIYLGTEWIFRWPGRPQADLVGVLDADTYLHLPDFRASEKTFQFIAQILAEVQSLSSDRSSREIIIQTRYPEHASIAWAREGNPDLFYSMELFERKNMGYPPFMRLAAILLKSTDQARATRIAQKLAHQLREALPEKEGFQILGPAPAPLTPLRSRHRLLLLVKAPTGAPLQEGIRQALNSHKRHGTSGVHIGIDVDPLRLR